MVLAPKDSLKLMEDLPREDAMTSTNEHPAEDIPSFEQIAADVLKSHAESVCFGCLMLSSAQTDEAVEMYADASYHEGGCNARQNPGLLVKFHLPRVLDRLGFIKASDLVEITVNVLSLLKIDDDARQH